MQQSMLLSSTHCAQCLCAIRHDTHSLAHGECSGARLRKHARTSCRRSFSLPLALVQSLHASVRSHLRRHSLRRFPSRVERCPSSLAAYRSHHLRCSDRWHARRSFAGTSFAHQSSHLTSLIRSGNFKELSLALPRSDADVLAACQVLSRNGAALRPAYQRLSLGGICRGTAFPLCESSRHRTNVPLCRRFPASRAAGCRCTRSRERGSAQFRAVMQATARPIADEKTVGPATSVVFLGILIDTVKLECRLTDERIGKAACAPAGLG